MRILISAYACEPDRGSEPEAGLRIVLAAASRHQVWVITRKNNIDDLEQALRSHPQRERIHLVGHDLAPHWRWVKKLGGIAALHWYYDRWQKHLGALAISLDERFDFDLVHHATFAAHWSRVGIAGVAKPLVLGPIGGAMKAPLTLLPVMGLRGLLSDLIRAAVRPIMARWTGATEVARGAAVVFAQNPEMAEMLHDPSRVQVLPNALAAITGAYHPGSLPIHHSRIVVAGRLEGWKGTTLAVRAMTHIVRRNLTMDIYGEGSQRGRLQRLIRRLNLEERVRLRGRIPRNELIDEVAQSQVFLHPALREEAGFVVAEALSVGTPVVCLDRGGPSVLISCVSKSVAVEPSTPARTARALAKEVESLIGSRAVVSEDMVGAFERKLLAGYETARRKRSR